MTKVYTTDDLIQLAKLGRFGNAEHNYLALTAFLNLKKLQNYCAEQDKKLENVQFFSIKPSDPITASTTENSNLETNKD